MARVSDHDREHTDAHAVTDLDNKRQRNKSRLAPLLLCEAPSVFFPGPIVIQVGCFFTLRLPSFVSTVFLTFLHDLLFTVLAGCLHRPSFEPYCIAFAS